MIWRIARKEVLSNIITLRFTVGTVLFLALVVTFTTVLISDYRQKIESYNELVSRNSSELRQLMTYRNLKPTVYKPPEVLVVFSKGVEENMGNSVQISIGEVPISKSAAGAKNPLLSIFPVLDIVLIFKLVISVLTLLLAYDAISGEKEDKTLGLMLSNNIPRHQVLFGKFIGGMITISVPIAIGFLVGGIILTVSPMISLSLSDWLRIVLMFFVSLIMVGVLFSLGLFFSSMTKRASDSLMLLLFMWVLFVLIIPNVSTYLADQMKPIESREKIDSQVQEMWREFNKEVRDFDIKISKTGTEYQVESDANEPWGWYHKFATKVLIRQEQELNAFSEPHRIECADKAWQAERGYLESLNQQKNFADMLSRFSPISLYEILISGLSRSDVASFEGFFEQTREYRKQIINYLYSKNAFSAIRYTATIKEEHLFDVSSMEEYGVLREKYDREEPSPLNIEDIPQFLYQPESVSATVKRILPDMALLCIIGILFFLCGFVAFLKYDVR